MHSYTDKELTSYIETYNEYQDDTMKVKGMAFCRIDQWLTLTINGEIITEGDIYDITDRVWQILRENGLDFFI